MQNVRATVYQVWSRWIGSFRGGSKASGKLRPFGLLLLLVVATLPGQADASPGLFFSSHPERVQPEQTPAASTAQALIGTGRGATEADARSQALEAIALQLQATLTSTYRQQVVESSAHARQTYTQHSVKSLNLQTGLAEQAGLSWVMQQTRGTWVAEARLDRALAMQALYQKSYLEPAMTFRTAASQALATTLHPVQFTPTWRQALKQYVLLPETAQAIELLAAAEARRPSTGPQQARQETEVALRVVQARASGEPLLLKVEETLATQRSILRTLESDRALYASLLDAGQQVWGRAVVQVRGSESPTTGENRDLNVSIQVVAIEALAAGLLKRNIAVDQQRGEEGVASSAERVTARLQTALRVQRSTPEFEPGPVSCEVKLGLQLELTDGSVVPLGKSERAVGRHRSEAKEACLAATRLLVEDVQWLDQNATFLCTILPCEVGS